MGLATTQFVEKSLNTDIALYRRIEEASLNSWPAMHQVLLDGWVLRFSGGFTKRSNSIIPLYPSLQSNIEDKVAYCEHLYTREKLRTLFRITSLEDDANLDDLLEKRSYEHVDPTLVMHRPISKLIETPNDFRILSLQDWLRAYCTLSGIPHATSRVQAVLLKSIRTDAIFGVTMNGDMVVACGLAVIEKDLVGLFDIVTDPAQRRRGYGSTIVESLLSHGAKQGANVGYLQVAQDNAPARALYTKLGFSMIYQYWYRSAGNAPT